MIDDDLLKWIIDKQDESPTLEYKERIYLETDGDKAQFVKDIISLANSGVKSYLIIGVKDGTKKLLGVSESFRAEQLNEILKNRCDPALTLEYDEKNIYGYKIGVIEIQGYNPPYLVSVHDKFGGKLTDNPNKQCRICRGTVYIRRHNQIEGACRADLDRIFMTKSPQPYLQIAHIVKSKLSKGNINNILVNFQIRNIGNAPAYNAFLYVNFNNAIRVTPEDATWQDLSTLNNAIPTLCTMADFPIIPGGISYLSDLLIETASDIDFIQAKLTLTAINMFGVLMQDPYKIDLR